MRDNEQAVLDEFNRQAAENGRQREARARARRHQADAILVTLTILAFVAGLACGVVAG